MKKTAWESYTKKDLKEVEKLSKTYIDFISTCKTERECVKYTVDLLQQNGYKDLASVEKVQAGDKVYAVNMGKAVAAFQIGQESLVEGMNILGAHIDSPRMDVKQNPLYEDGGLAYLDTHYYGGIKKYQWVTLPLAIHGVVIKKDGTVVEANIGEKPGDPVFFVSDLLIHLAQEQVKKEGAKVVDGEDLDILFGTIPLKDTEKEAVKSNLLKMLETEYKIEEDDFLSAELEIVPAGPAREAGFDRSMIFGYGHDDRCCAYPSLTALLKAPKTLHKTACCLLVDKEEIGSYGATGMQSRFFEDMVAELLEKMGEFSELNLRRTMRSSHMLSSDVSAAYDALYGEVFDKKNTAYLGKGVVFNKYTGARGKSGSSDANPEYIAKLRAILDKDKVFFQFAELGKVDRGGGGTIAHIMAKYGMNVIDSGVAVLNMHAPWEAISKADLYEAEKCYLSFIKNMK